MRNRDLERLKDRAIKELGDYQSTAEAIISELVSEIESLEDDKETLQGEVDDAISEIHELNERIKELEEEK